MMQKSAKMTLDFYFCEGAKSNEQVREGKRRIHLSRFIKEASDEVGRIEIKLVKLGCAPIIYEIDWEK